MPEPGSALKETLRALLHPAPLVAAAVALALALWVKPVLAVPVIVIYVLLVYALGPMRLRARRAAIELGLDMKDAPPSLRRWNAVLTETLGQIQRDLAQADRDNARLLQPVTFEVDGLGADIRRLIRRAYAVHRYLTQTNLPFVTQRIAHLEAQIAATSDAFSRQQLTEAVEALRRQVENCEQLRVLLGRTEATLENMHASLQSIGSSVVKINAGGATEAQLARDDSLQRVTSARGTVAALEQVLEAVELA